MQVGSIDELPDEQVVALFQQARAKEYEILLREAAKLRSSGKRAAVRATRLRRRFQEIAAVDFFESPLRSRVEAALARMESREAEPARSERRGRNNYLNRTWITRPRPGIDRVSSAWLIRNFIDKNARFIFDSDPSNHPDAIPFDMFHAGGFGHRGDDCTFETLCKEFALRDPRVKMIAQIIHDADLDDERFGRCEGVGLDRVLIGWAQQGVSDDELLRRGMEMIAGLYQQMG
jgi:hypothetical protein